MAGNGFIDVEVKGLKELEQSLKRLPDDLALKALAQAVFSGAKVVRDDAQRLCPVEEGDLRKAIRIKRVKKFSWKNVDVLYQVGPGRSGKKGKDGKYAVDGYYGLMVEKGTKPHIIKATVGKVLVLRPNKRASKKVANRWMNTFADVVEHPGATPKPFLRPAFDNNVTRVLETVRAKLAAAIERGEITYWRKQMGWM